MVTENENVKIDFVHIFVKNDTIYVKSRPKMRFLRYLSVCLSHT